MTKYTLTDAEAERLFTADRCISVIHCYCVGEYEDGQHFSIGYWTDDGAYLYGVWAYRGDRFEKS